MVKMDKVYGIAVSLMLFQFGHEAFDDIDGNAVHTFIVVSYFGKSPSTSKSTQCRFRRESA